MYSADNTPKGWVAPFGHPGIKACSQLLRDFRSVPRPSSPPGAKASTECPSLAPTKPTLHRNNQPGHNQQTRQPQPRHRPSHKAGPHSTHALTNAPEPCNSRRASPASLPNRETNRHGSDTHATAVTDHPKPTCNPANTPRHKRTPSRPACPGAHQNLIHSCQRPNTRHAQPEPRPTAVIPTQTHRSHRHGPRTCAHPRQTSTTSHAGPSPNARATRPQHRRVEPSWRWTGSNRRPPACKAGALPAELHPHTGTQNRAPYQAHQFRAQEP